MCPCQLFQPIFFNLQPPAHSSRFRPLHQHNIVKHTSVSGSHFTDSFTQILACTTNQLLRAAPRQAAKCKSRTKPSAKYLLHSWPLHFCTCILLYPYNCIKYWAKLNIPKPCRVQEHSPALVVFCYLELLSAFTAETLSENHLTLLPSPCDLITLDNQQTPRDSSQTTHTSYILFTKSRDCPIDVQQRTTQLPEVTSTTTDRPADVQRIASVARLLFL